MNISILSERYLYATGQPCSYGAASQCLAATQRDEEGPARHLPEVALRLLELGESPEVTRGRYEDEGGHLEVEKAARGAKVTDAPRQDKGLALAETENLQETAEDSAQQRCSNMSNLSIGQCGNLNCLLYRARNKGLCVVARNFFLLLLNCSAWPCLAAA